MKLAVVEYTSKSGGVWQHTDATPNYLADPLREIDPTSFGGYVSAFESSHIPLTGLILGPVVNVPRWQQLWRKLVKRVRGRWPTDYDISPLLDYDALLVVHQLSDAHELVGLLRRLRTMPNCPFLIGVPTQPYGLLRQHVTHDAAAEHDLVAFMNECDLFLSVVESTVAWYQRATTTPVVYVPQPYPASFAAKAFVPRAKKRKEIIVAGVTQRPNIRQGQRVAKRLQEQFPDYLIRVPKVADLSYDTTALGEARVDVLPFEAWREHLHTLAHARLVINTDYTETRGRVQVDCAAVGTPSLGGDSDGERDLFPDLGSTPDTSDDALVELGAQLLTDDAFYDAVVARAADRLHKYDYQESRARLELLIRTYQTKAV